MAEYSWIWIALVAVLILCCVLPMLFMKRRSQRGMNDRNDPDQSHTKT